MTTLLHIAASPRGEKSESLALAETFLDTYRDTNPDHIVETWNLWDGTLPEFGPAAAAAKMAVFAGADPQGESAAAWRDATERSSASPPPTATCSACRCGTPGALHAQAVHRRRVPAGHGLRLRPGRRYTGPARGKKAAVIYTAAIYGPGRGPAFGADFQAPFFRDWLSWAGIHDVTEVHFRPNLATADAAAAGRLPSCRHGSWPRRSSPRGPSQRPVQPPGHLAQRALGGGRDGGLRVVEAVAHGIGILGLTDPGQRPDSR